MMLRDRKPFHFIKLRKYWYAISLLIIIPGIISIFSQGLNLGIDFKGGGLLDLRFNQATEVVQVRAVLEEFDLAGASIQRSGDTDFLVRTRELSEEENASIIQSLDQNLGGVTVQRSVRVGPVISSELIRNSLMALGVAAILMLVYVAWRFELKQGIAAVIAILHNVLIVTAVFSIFQLEVDSTFVAAILTIIGYSINDTIVIFDRIRENMLNKKKDDLLEDVINTSLWQTIARSINTGISVIFVLVALLLYGGATIHNMMLALLIGVIVGAYSSIFNASPLWYDMKKSEFRQKPKAARA